MLSPSTDFALRLVRICGNLDTPQITIARVFKTAFILEASIVKKCLFVLIHCNLFVAPTMKSVIDLQLLFCFKCNAAIKTMNENQPLLYLISVTYRVNQRRDAPLTILRLKNVLIVAKTVLYYQKLRGDVGQSSTNFKG